VIDYSLVAGLKNLQGYLITLFLSLPSGPQRSDLRVLTTHSHKYFLHNI